ncbi:putative rho GTPase activator [Rosellinia necatrix]|uniref:Putative rho GTPase activator n=1 Tax=Rosellinia necatrix TaxID=77044 RepID=A0A1W2TGH7_ROSNE|nr:putative rho GTPase activator [Rosellinia necatrix]
MTDFSRASIDNQSPLQPDYEQPANMSPRYIPSPPPEAGAAAPTNGPRPGTSTGAMAGAGAAGAEASLLAPADGAKSETSQRVQDVLGSDIGIITLLNRLKQSIASAKEFALFLKKRSVLEEEHARGLKKLCKSNQDSIHHSDHRQGTFAKSYEGMLTIHDRMAENGTQFALSLHQMHEDLLEVAAVAEKHRKGWKQNGLAAEQRLVDIELAMRKSKVKYDGLAEEYDRVRTGEARQGPRVFGIKGPKSAAQHEEELLRKTQAADTDYMGKVQAYQSEKATMESTTRPEAIKALQDLIRECDSGTTLQLQKFASFNEKLLLSNGLVISPLKSATFADQYSHSLKEVIHSIDNKKDLEDYISSFHSKLSLNTPEPKYERNPVLNPQHNMSSNQMATIHQQAARPQSQQQAQGQNLPPLQTQIPPTGSFGRTATFDTAPSSAQGFMPPPMQAAQRPSSGLGHERSYSHGAMLTQSNVQPQQTYNTRNSTHILPQQSRFSGNVSSPLSSQSGPPQLGALPFQTQPSRAESPPQGGPSTFTGPSPQQELPGRSASPPNTYSSPSAGGKQVFGVSLARLYERDQFAVPMVVHQCIQAVDLYGLAVEGIYRLSGSATHVNKLKNLFDTNQESHILDFRNPENFFHDVNSVAGLLKQFLRDLPDPLLTSENYTSFIDAAKHDDETVRRDSMHAIINGLPDPNYATLRALTLHLYRVMENSTVNRMNSQNLAIVFGPTLMGTAPGSNIADAAWQVRAVDTILQNTYQIFDED